MDYLLRDAAALRINLKWEVGTFLVECLVGQHLMIILLIICTEKGNDQYLIISLFSWSASLRQGNLSLW